MDIWGVIDGFNDLEILVNNWVWLVVIHLSFITGVFAYLYKKKIISEKNIQKKLNPDFNFFNFKYPYLVLIVLTIIGVLLNKVNVNLFFGVNLIFGSAISIFILMTFNKRVGLLAGAVISFYSYFLWGHYYAFIIFQLELTFISLFNWKYLKSKLFKVVTLYWTFIGIPLIYLFYSFGLNMDSVGVVTILLKQSINGLLNAVIAMLLFMILVYRFDKYLPMKGPKFKLGTVIATSYLITSFLIIFVTSIFFTNEIIKNKTLTYDSYLKDNKQLYEVTLNSKLKNAIDGIIYNSVKNDFNFNKSLNIALLNELFESNPGLIGFNLKIDDRSCSLTKESYIEDLQVSNSASINESLFYKSGVYEGEPVFIITKPLNKAENENIDYIQIFITKEFFLTDDLKNNEFHYALLDENGVCLLENGFKDYGNIGMKTLFANFVIMESATANRLLPAEKDLPAMLSWRKSRMVLQFQLNDYGRTKFILALPLTDFIFEVQKEIIFVMAITLFFVVLVVGISNIIRRIITKHMANIVNVSHKLVESKDYSERMNLPSSVFSELDSLTYNIDNLYTKIIKEANSAEQYSKDLSSMIQNANALIIGFDLNFLITEWNHQIELLTGFTIQDIKGKNFISDFIHPDNQKLILTTLENLSSKKETLDALEFKIKTSTNRYILVLMNFSKRFHNGESFGWVSIGQDITELNKYREMLEVNVSERTKELNQSLSDIENARDKIEGILKSIPEGLIVCDIRGRVEQINRAGEDLFNQRLSDLINRDCVHTGIPLEIVEIIKEVSIGNLLNQRSFEFNELKYRKLNGKTIKGHVSTVYNKDNQSRGSVTIFHEV